MGKEDQIAELVALWACDQMEDLEKKEYWAVGKGVYFQLREITKQYPHLLQGNYAERFRYFLEHSQIPKKD